MNEINIVAIRGLLRDAFTAQDLWRFCQERPTFRPVLIHFPFNATQAQMIDALTEYCRTRALYDDLLAARRRYPARASPITCRHVSSSWVAKEKSRASTRHCAPVTF